MKQKRLIYPLINRGFIPMTKTKINFWWAQQPFRLNLKGYQGNCITCWKKSDPKLFQIARENEHNFDFMRKMEERYGRYTPESRRKLMEERGDIPVYPITFFRKNRSALDIINESKFNKKPVIDDSQTAETLTLFDDLDLIGGESCEIYSECGS